VGLPDAIPPLPSEIVAFIEDGVTLSIGTRDREGMPETVRGCGVVVLPGAARLRIYVPVDNGALTLANLREDARIAITMCRPITHQTIQVKGRAAAIRDADPSERPVVEAYREAYQRTLSLIGLPPRISSRLAIWPAAAVEVELSEVYGQTPGPDAGARMARRS
jgi:hypothetical protein